MTQEGWGGDGAIAAGHHHANPCLHKGNGEIDDLWALLIDRQWSHGHDGFLIHHLQEIKTIEGSKLYTHTHTQPLQYLI